MELEYDLILKKYIYFSNVNVATAFTLNLLNWRTHGALQGYYTGHRYLNPSRSADGRKFHLQNLILHKSEIEPKSLSKSSLC